MWRSSRKKANPAKKEDIVDLGSKFGMSFGSDSDSSDAEFAPENETIDSDGMIDMIRVAVHTRSQCYCSNNILYYYFCVLLNFYQFVAYVSL